MPSDYTDPRVATVLPQVRKLVTDGKFAEASTAAEAMISQPTEVDMRISVCLVFYFNYFSISYNANCTEIYTLNACQISSGALFGPPT